MMRKNKDRSGQTMVEFALALPIVLVIVFGVIEFGFLLWSYSSVNSAAREAARYGITIGDGTGSGLRYYDCEGIRNAAMKAGTFAGMVPSDVFIHYDDGTVLDDSDPGYSPKYNTCEELAALSGDDEIVFGDRIVISVTHDYHPIASLIGFDIQPFNMIARSNRTIVKNIIVSTGGDGGGGGGGGEETACFSLLTTHTGDGTDPTVSPAKSSGCDVIGEYVGGEDLTLTAAPDSGWSVDSWVNTDNDASASTSNTLNMPGAPTTVTVNYVNAAATCYTLNTSTTGAGSGTLAVNKANSTGCASGTYLAGENLVFSATPDVGSEVGTWTGTDNPTGLTNTKTMPAVEGYSISVEFNLTSTTCYTLIIGGHTGTGTDPVPSASNCAGGLYTENTSVTLNASPGAGYEVSGWNGTNNDASTSTTNTVTMTGDKVVSVDYVQSFTPGPPLNVYIPNNLALGEWKWNSGLPACQKIDLRWSANPAWSPNSPLYYNVSRSGTFYDTINGTYWDANLGVSKGQTITLGVQAVFSGGVTSSTTEVTYICLEAVLDYWGSVIK